MQLIQTGTVNGTTPIMADIGTNGACGGYPGAVQVTMNAGCTYVMAAPPGYPSPPFLTGSATPFHPGMSFGPGSMLALLQPEAAALIAAGAATLLAYV